jgi:hypothetical protein
MFRRKPPPQWTCQGCGSTNLSTRGWAGPNKPVLHVWTCHDCGLTVKVYPNHTVPWWTWTRTPIDAVEVERLAAERREG